MKEEKDLKVGAKGSATAKVRKLQKQYNKILVDLFDQFAAESIEEALETDDGSFGSNIQNIVQSALDNLRDKVLKELGVEASSGMAVAIDGVFGGMPPSIALGENEPEEGETEEHEENESEEFEAGEEEEREEQEEEAEKEEGEELEEKAPPGKKMERMVKHIKKSAKKAGKSPDEAKQVAYATAWKKYNESDETLKRDKVISTERRNDQSLLTEIYAGMYKKV